MRQKICTMNCGPALSDTRSQAERMAKCEDCVEVERDMEETMEEKHTRGPWEPVAWMVYTLDGTSVCVTDNPADFTDEHRALPLYTKPFPTDEALLREALYALEYASDMTKPEDLQGCGCPICTSITALRERLADTKVAEMQARCKPSSVR